MSIRYLFLSFSLFITFSVYAQDITTGVTACYPFQGDGKDVSGNNNDATIHGATLTTDRFGNPNAAYQFDGTADITLPPDLIFPNINFTVSFWMNLSQYPASNDFDDIFSFGNAHNDTSMSIRTVNYPGIEQIDFYGCVRYPENDPRFTAPFQGVVFEGGGALVNPALGSWVQIIMVSSADNISVYFNSKDYESTIYYYDVPALYKYPGVVKLGTSSDGIHGFHGVIDDVTIYNRALTTDDVALLLTHGSVCGPGQPPIISDVASCTSGSFSLTASNGDSFNWYNASTGGDLLFQGNPFKTPVLTNTTSYYVTSVAGSGESSRTKVTVTILEEPTVHCSIPQNAVPDLPVTLSISTTHGDAPLSYAFTIGSDTTLVTADSSLQKSFADTGDYLITIKATSVNGCSSECSGNISVMRELMIPNVITENADTLNQMFTVYFKNDDGAYVVAAVTDFKMTVYDRWGGIVFSSSDATTGWDGKNSAENIFFYSIDLGRQKFKGWLSVVR